MVNSETKKVIQWDREKLLIRKTDKMITLKVGDKAPDFTAKDQQGNTVSLADFRGKKLVLYFFPESGSPTCTIESCNLRDHYNILKQEGYEVLGISPDSSTVQQKFKEKYQLPFSLISDNDQQVLKSFGAWDKKKLFGREYMGVLRTTFIIEENGTINRIFHRPKNKAHAQEILGAS